MSSKKKSARAAQKAAFQSQLGDQLGGVFAREDARREEHRRHKACDRKKRYASRSEAEDAIRDCRRHGSPDLHCYECDFCGGWHLTHKPARR